MTIYISDLDGTLLNGDAELSEYTIKTLNAMIAGGINFTVATARTPATAFRILAPLTLRLPIVLMNGVLIYDTEQRRYIKVNKLAPETVASVVVTMRDFEITGFMYELSGGEFMTYHESLEKEPLRDFVEQRIAKYNKAFRHTEGFENISRDDIIYFTLLDTYERLRPVLDALESQPGLNHTFYPDTYRPGLWYLEMFSPAASKQSAVDYLRETPGYERVVGFGDNLNDLPMFAACDVKVAPENANPEVKAAADCICGGSDSDGVVRWLEGNL